MPDQPRTFVVIITGTTPGRDLDAERKAIYEHLEGRRKALTDIGIELVSSTYRIDKPE